MKLRQTPLNKKGGIVTSTVMGVGGLIIAVIVMLVIISTLFSANLFKDVRETNSTTDQIVNLTFSGINFGDNTLQGASCVTTLVETVDGIEITSNNYTVTASNCSIIANAGSEYNNTNINISSTTTFYGVSEQGVDSMKGNMTVGIDSISSKIPTILLIVAVVFLFGALVLLMRNAKALGVGGGGSL